MTSLGLELIQSDRFQSTHLHEVWRSLGLELIQSDRFQSTHLHEVWQKRWEHQTNIYCFNPHTYMRCDLIHDLLLIIRQFQSTHLHEVWRKVSKLIIIIISFNPHTYMRCDLDGIGYQDLIQVSIHTPTWGVTIRTTHSHSSNGCFNPHTYMRCDIFYAILL